MKAERVQPKDGASISICSIPLIGIPVAQQLWPGGNELTVILTPEELREWQQIYDHPNEAYWWWTDHWWNIDAEPDPRSVINRDRDIRVAAGESPWLVTSGISWGPMAGGATTELWSWNGKEAKYIRDVGKMMF